MSDSSPLLIRHVCGRTGRCFCSGGEGCAGFIIANRAESFGQSGGHAGTRFTLPRGVKLISGSVSIGAVPGHRGHEVRQSCASKP